MSGKSIRRRIVVNVLCLILIGLVGVVGIAQAIHAHPEDSTSVRHTCSICVTAHAGLSVETASIAPVLLSATPTTSPEKPSGLFRPATSQFIRPPPAV